jgi:hypothetical protein
VARFEPGAGAEELRTEVYFCHQNQNAKNIGNFMTQLKPYNIDTHLKGTIISEILPLLGEFITSARCAPGRGVQGCKLSGIYRNSGISPCFFQCGGGSRFIKKKLKKINEKKIDPPVSFLPPYKAIICLQMP